VTDPFEHSPLLSALGLDHGFGLRGSAEHALPNMSQVQQVHGATLLRAPVAPSSEADALWTDTPGLGVAVRTADCVPLLIAHRERACVAAVHAGWRGTAAGVALRSVAGLVKQKRIDPAELVVVMGPHIAACCYEVDEVVREAIGFEAGLLPGRPGHYMLDLEACNRAQLTASGIGAGAISRVGGCTSCDPVRYASYRRDGSGDRMLHYVRMPRS
jgi:YfiH family protein